LLARMARPGRSQSESRRRAGPAVWMALVAAVASLASGCLKVAPYQKPAAAAPQQFKEAPPAGWKEAQPSDGTLRGKWWEVFNDPSLNALEEQVPTANQNLQEAEANFRQAQAAVRIARTGLYPTISAAPSVTGAQQSSRLATGGNSSPFAVLALPVSASYTYDLWGSIHRGIAQSANTAQALAAAMESARLLYQAELAQDYFELHGADADAALLQDAANSYKEYLTLTQVRYQGGVATDADVAQAETQLYTTQAQLTDLEVQRSQFEHAIAILVGKPPAEFSIPRAPTRFSFPAIPVSLPSALLERRPDIAEVERQAAAANQQIGVAQAAFYPTLSFSASAGVEAASLINWITWPSRFWTLGPQLAQILFDAGRRTAQVAQAQAGYDATAAAYRQTVLTAFQQVEDNLAALRVLENEAKVLEQAVSSAQRAVTVSDAQYKGGTATYLQVITTQTIALQDERSALDVQTRRMVAMVGLIQALGGGWDPSSLPTEAAVAAK